MKTTRTFFLAALIAGVLTLLSAHKAEAQVSFGINIGPAPVCPYGYYGYAPYRCAPYGYYGPQWFTNGAFLGAGPWYRGPRGFYGPVNRRYDPRFGYRGAYPGRGGFVAPADNWRGFHGNAYHDYRGYGRGGGRWHR